MSIFTDSRGKRIDGLHHTAPPPPSSRPEPSPSQRRRHFAPAACFLLALVGLWPVAASAQTTLVSNCSKAESVAAGVWISSGMDYARSFVTGSLPGGYSLHSIGLPLDGNGDVKILRVKLYSSAPNGKPGSLLRQLANPASLNSGGLGRSCGGLSEFRAPAGVVLAPATRYFVVVEQFSTQSGVRWRRASAGKDNGSAEDWELPAAMYGWINGSWRTSGLGGVIAVKGAWVPLTPTLTLTPDSIAESGGESTVAVTLNRPPSADTTVTVSPAADGEYRVSGSPLTFAAGQTTTADRVTIAAVDNAVDSPDREVSVSAAAENGADATALGEATLTIEDDDDTPTLTIHLDPPSISENGGQTTVTATLSHASSEHTSVEVDMRDRHNHYRVSGLRRLVIEAGQMTSEGLVTLTAVNNNVRAPDKEVRVKVRTRNDHGVPTVTWPTLTILDDDTPTLTLRLDPPSINENGGTSTVTAKLNRSRSADTTVTVSPAADGEYRVSGSPLTIAAGQTTTAGRVTITAVDNTVDSPDREVTVSAEATSNAYATATSEAMLTLEDDDDTPTLTIHLDPSSISENGGQTTVTATLSHGSSEYTLVEVDRFARWEHYRVSFPAIFSFAPGETTTWMTHTVTITAVDNDVQAPDKGVRVKVRTRNRHGVPRAIWPTLTIVDDDAPTVTLRLDPPSIGENGGKSAVKARLNRRLKEDTTVTVSAVPVPPTTAEDYRLSGNLELRIPAGRRESEGAVTITAVDNDVEAPDGRVAVSGTVVNSAGVIGPDAVTLTLADDDRPALSIRDAAADEGNAGGAAMTFRVTLDRAAGETVTVDWETRANQTARAGADFTAADGSLTFNVGETEKTLSVTVLDDDVDERNETFRVILSNASSGARIGDGGATGTIRDSDGPPTVILGLSRSSISENGGTSVVTADLSHASSAATTVTVRPSAGDYDLGSNRRLRIPAGATTSATSTWVTITALDNNVDEPNRSVAVTATAANGLAIVRPQAVALRIRDDDDPPTVTLGLSRSSISENGGTSLVTARLSHPSSAATTVTVLPLAGDYALGSSATLTIPAGMTESAGAVTITGVDNDWEAPDKAVAVAATAENEQGVVAPQAVTLTIRDDDRPQLSIADVRLAEGDSGVGEMAFAVKLNRTATREVTVDWATFDGTAEAGSDYRAGRGSLKFGVGDIEKTVSVRVTGDRTDEPNETFRVRLSNASGAALGRASATGTIRDDDDAPRAVLALSPDMIGEAGGVSRVKARLDRPSSEDTTVTVSAVPSGGYMLSSNRLLRISAGATESVGLVTISATSTPAIVSGTSTPATIGAGHRTVTVLGTAENDLGVVDPQSVTLAIVGPALAPFLPPASALGLEGFVRILNHSGEAGEVTIAAIDDTGARAGTVMLPIAANAAAQFNSSDLEEGNPGKGIAEGVGAGQGNWRLVLRSALPVTALAYVRTDDGLVAPMHDLAPFVGDASHVAFFNPAGNLSQMSRLRLVNLGGREAEVTVAGTDDAGVTSEAVASVAVPAGGASDLTADELEAALGDGEGKWRLAVRSAEPILAMSLLASPDGHLANISTLPARAGDGGAHVVPLFPSASDAFGRQGFVRVVNRSAQAGEVIISARDDSGFAYDPVTLAIGAGATTHFNSDDLELGNVGKGLTGSTGSGVGDWRLELASGLDLDVLAYVRMSDGLLASMHDVAPTPNGGAHWIAFFNPADNLNQVSSLRLVNPGAADAAVTVTGIDDRGVSPGGTVALAVPAGAARTLSAAELENGADGLDGALGDGAGKWRLRVVSDQPILAMSLLADPAGRLVNLSSAPGIVNLEAATTPSDGDRPALSIGDAAADEGDAGGVALAFRVALDRAASGVVTADWTTADGTAQAGADYAAGSGRLIFGGGEISRTVTVTAAGDNLDEPNETFTLRLSNVSGARLGKAAGTGTIRDDDSPPTVTLGLSSASISENGGTSGVTARLSHPSSAATTVTVPTSVHYSLGSNAALTIPAGALTSATSTPVTITALDNNADTPNRLVALTAAAENALGVVGPQAVTLTITDDDGPPTVILALSSVSISENGGTSSLTVRLSHPSGVDTMVTVTASDDYTLSSNGMLTIPAGMTESAGGVTITGVDNDVKAPDKAVALTAAAQNALGVVGPRAVTLTITDDDRLWLSIADARLAEGDSGGAEMAFAVTLNRAATAEVGVDWTTSDETAEDGSDYSAGSGSLRFHVGEIDKTMSVRVMGDRTDEPNETFTVRLSNASGAELSRALATGTIRDDDAEPKAALALSPDAIGEASGVSRVTASLDRPSSEDTTVTVSAASESGGYALSANRLLRIPAGTTESAGLVTVSASSTPAAISATSTPALIGAGHRVVTVSGTAENDLGVVDPRSVTLAITGPSLAPFLPPASTLGLEGFVRVLNHSDAAGEVAVAAIDDAGVLAGTVTLPIAANAGAHFSAADLEEGNPGKGLAEGVGAGQGNWRLVLRSALPITALAYVRTDDGLVAPMHDVAPTVGDSGHVAFFNPAGNLERMSRLRLVNLGGREAEVTVVGTDDAGVTSEAAASVTVPAGGASELTAGELEAALGAGQGRWRLAVRSDEPLLAMSLLASPAGHLTNLSTVPAPPGDGGAHVVPFFPSASDAFGRQGFVRVANRSAQAGEVTISAHDDSGFAYDPVTLAIGAGAAAHFNSDDLELGNAESGLTGSTGSGVGDWRLELTSALDLEVLAYVRMSDGILASMHDVAPLLADGAHWVAFFNPADNLEQASSLRLVNPGGADAAVTITGVDDQGASPGGAVTLTVPAGASRTLGAAELESGAAGLDFADGLEGALGDGSGKWRLRVVSDQPILVMSLLTGPGGRLTNLSSAPRRGLR